MPIIEAWHRKGRISAISGSSFLKCEVEGFLRIWPGWLPESSSRSGPRRSLGRPFNPLGPDRTDIVASVTIEVDLPPGVEITGYERHQDGHSGGLSAPAKFLDQ